MTVVLSELKNKDDFTKFTVLACYCIHFSKDENEFVHMFANVCKKHMSDKYSVQQISKSSRLARIMMEPSWRKAEKVGSFVEEASKIKSDLKELRKDLREAEHKYENAEWAGGQLYMQTCKEKIKKIKKQISEKKELLYGKK